MSERVNPEMLVLARESRGMTQSELAQTIGVSQGKVSKYESGLLAVSDDLQRLARALDYPEHFFLQKDEVRATGSGCLYHRKRQSMPVQELRQIHALVNVTRMQVARLLQGADVDTQNGFFRLDIEDNPDGPEGIARRIRSAWGLPNGPIANLACAVENAGGIVVQCSFGTNKLDAISQWVPGLPPLFFVNRDTPADRRRFSLAHEVGHVVMHRLLTEDAEAEADRFAAEILVPGDQVKPHLNSMTIQRAAAMKPYWRVSMAALIRRAYDLKCITESTYRRLFTQLSQLGYRTNEPSPIPDEEPTVLRDLVDLHLRHHQYTPAELGRLLACHEHELHARYLPERPYLRLVKEDEPEA